MGGILSDLGEVFNPVDWYHAADKLWHDVTGGASGIVGTIEKWVLHAIHWAIQGVENDIALVRGAIAGVASAIDDGLQAVWHGLDRAYQDALAVGKEVETFAVHEAEAVGRDAEHYADDVGSFVVHDVLDPAVHEVEHLVDAVEYDAVRGLDWLYHDVVLPIAHDAREAYDKAVAIASWVDHEALDAVHLVSKCWDFLTWVADHPMHALEMLPKLLEDAYAAPAASKIETEVSSVWSDLEKGLETLVGDFTSAADK